MHIQCLPISDVAACFGASLFYFALQIQTDFHISAGAYAVVPRVILSSASLGNSPEGRLRVSLLLGLLAFLQLQ